MRSSTSLHREIDKPDNDFRRIQDLVYKHTAIVVSDDKIDFVKARVAKRLRRFDIESLGEYCDRVESGEESLIDFTSQMTTNHTSFFRESHHFDTMTNSLLLSGVDNMVIWSSACSTGEEPYSIAIALVEKFHKRDYEKIRILASDIDEKVLSTAKKGIYSEERVNALTNVRKQLAFEPAVKTDGRQFRIREELRRMIEFRQANLVEPLSIASRVNIIFCRNVAIYFDRKTKIHLFDRFAALQQPGDLLFVGHSENLNELSNAYACIGGTAYRRR